MSDTIHPPVAQSSARSPVRSAARRPRASRAAAASTSVRRACCASTTTATLAASTSATGCCPRTRSSGAPSATVRSPPRSTSSGSRPTPTSTPPSATASAPLRPPAPGREDRPPDAGRRTAVALGWSAHRKALSQRAIEAVPPASWWTPWPGPAGSSHPLARRDVASNRETRAPRGSFCAVSRSRSA